MFKCKLIFNFCHLAVDMRWESYANMAVGPVFVTRPNPTQPNPSMKNIPLRIITTVMSQHKNGKNLYHCSKFQVKPNKIVSHLCSAVNHALPNEWVPWLLQFSATALTEHE